MGPPGAGPGAGTPFGGPLRALRGAAGGGVGEVAAAEAVRGAGTEAAATLRLGEGSLSELVQALEVDLGGDGGAAERARAVEFLAVIAEEAAGGLVSGELGHLAVFLASRVASDWPTMRPGLRACLCLLRCEGDGPQGRATPRLSEDAACAVATAVARDADVPAQPQAVRRLAFQCLRVFFERHGSPGALAGREEELAEGTVLALEGEKDPRCLLEGLGALTAMARALGACPPGRLALRRIAYEAVDILSCYFPVVFTPPPTGAPEGLTREAIVEALVSALSCCPEFAPHAAGLATQKSSSPNHRTQLECLQLLRRLLKELGPTAALAPVPVDGEHEDGGDRSEGAARLWSVLGPLFGAVAAPGIGDEERVERQQVAEAAADVLGDFLHCCRDESGEKLAPLLGDALEEEALGDARVETLLRFLDGDRDSILEEKLHSVRATGYILLGAASGHIEACERVLRTALPLCTCSSAPKPEGAPEVSESQWDLGAARLLVASDVLGGAQALCRRSNVETGHEPSVGLPGRIMDLLKAHSDLMVSSAEGFSELPGGAAVAAPLFCSLASFPPECQVLGEKQLESVLAAVGRLWARDVCAGGTPAQGKATDHYLEKLCATCDLRFVHASALEPSVQECFPSVSGSPNLTLLRATASLVDVPELIGAGGTAMAGLAPFLLEQFLQGILSESSHAGEGHHLPFLLEVFIILRDNLVPACCRLSEGGVTNRAALALEAAATTMLKFAAGAGPGGSGIFCASEGGADLCVLSAETAAAVARGLSEETQVTLAAQAETLVAQYRATGLEQPEVLLAQSAVLLGFPEGTALEKPGELAQTLLLGALSCPAASLALALAESMGGVLAKLKDQSDLTAAAELILDATLYPRLAISDDDSQESRRGLMCLAWICRALVVRSHPRAKGELLNLMDFCRGNCALGAAQGLGVVIGDAVADRCALNLWPRRFLHCQWVFSVCLPALSARVAESDGDRAARGVLRAKAWLVVSVPPAVAQQALGPRLSSSLVGAFQALLAPDDPRDADAQLLDSLIRYIGAVLNAEPSKLSEGLLNHAVALAGHLTDCSSFGSGWAAPEVVAADRVRETALLALAVLATTAPKADIFPKLHPIRRRLEQARDDPRRAVRAAAVKALRAWSSALS